MSEFQEVVRQAKRMCEAQSHCGGCPAIKTCFTGLKNMEVDNDRCCEFERVVRQWAEEYPEPRYPSWREAWKQLFPDGQRAPCPGCCGKKYAPEWCGQEECGECKNRPIPADVAEKLGIKPIGGVNDA